MRSSYFLLPFLLFVALGLGNVSYGQDITADEGGTVIPVIDTTMIPEDATVPAETITEGEPVSPPEDTVVPENTAETGNTDVETPDGQEEGAAAAPASDEASVDPLTAAEMAAFSVPLDILGMKSLFFTKWEHDLLIDARSGANVRPVVPGDAGSELLLPPDGASTVENSPREINLNGIAYVSPVSWTIWLNNIRITPTALLPEIMDLTVYKDRIEIEWLDRQTNQIYPIRLRPHEKFNMDTRMFLPADSE